MKQSYQEAISLLKKLIETPSISRQEEKTADIIEVFLKDKGFEVTRKYNNVWVEHINDKLKPTVLLNSHHDTVKPVESWKRKPYYADIVVDKLFGLGSNDAGASLVSLMMTFIYLSKQKNTLYNYIFLASAEEEVSGINGISSVLSEIGEIDFAIVGEPTGMNMAIAEKGLMVLDCTAKGKAGHAARDEGINAITIAVDDIKKLENYQFQKSSELLGDVKLTVSQINAGIQHNVVPETCSFVVDVRTNEHYSNKEVYEIIDKLLKSNVKARSFRLNSSSIPGKHEIIQKGLDLGLKTYGSPTLSDQALMSFPSVKMGPGESARSHTANEFIYLSEIENGIKTYIELLE
ncbi:MAG: acetylornithine deacetylase [Bacteroidetes bacterium]|nr:MAG: acetylornithine deacetylase [Bacteroidota bacterium]